MTYYFDMDGTIADLYGVKDWRKKLEQESVLPYAEARPLVDCERLRQAIEELKAEGYKFGIISWTSRAASPNFCRKIRKAKLDWLNEFFPSCFNEIHVIKYGTPKYRVAKDDGFLFDDEERNRKEWNKGKSYTEKEIFKVLE